MALTVPAARGDSVTTFDVAKLIAAHGKSAQETFDQSSESTKS